MEMLTIPMPGHNSHAHLIEAYTDTEPSAHGHNVGLASESLSCVGVGGSYPHDHALSLSYAGGHSHYVIVYTSTVSATDLYHVHYISGYTYSSTFPHSHSASSCDSGGCAFGVCSSNKHTHSFSGTTAEADLNHSHSLQEAGTSYGYGTLYWHYHTFINLACATGSHTHSGCPSLGTVSCWYSFLHGHGGGTIPAETHYHNFSGNTAYAGEPPPLPTKKTFSPPVL